MSNDPSIEKRSELDDIIEKDKERKRKRFKEKNEITLKEYYDLIGEGFDGDKKLSQNAPARLYEQILSYGIEELSEQEQWLGATKRYFYFQHDLFGIDAIIEDVMSHLEAGAYRGAKGKKLLMLAGPTSSGKSTLLKLFNKALEKYNLRKVYAIKGCKIHEDPLHAIPRRNTKRDWDPRDHEKGARPVEDILGIPPIQGDLCHQCRHMLKEKYTDPDGTIRWWDVPVEAFTFSTQGSRGISTFELLGQDWENAMSTLVGHENIQITASKGHEHPDAYAMDGEIQKANRGKLEGKEILKSPKVLNVFIGLCEEQEIKIQGSSFPHIHIDTWAAGSCNLKEFKEFSANQSNAALHDRIYVVPCPYTLKINDEIKIYKKLIEQESDFKALKNLHIPDISYRIAAIFAGLTRVHDSSFGVDRLTKLKIYNGEKALTEIKDKDKRPLDTRALIQEYNNDGVEIDKQEGMFGISYRDILTALNNAISKLKVNGCLTPELMIDALRDIFKHSMGYSEEEKKRFLSLLDPGKANVMSEYEDYVITMMRKAFVRGFADIKRSIKRKYIKEMNLYCSQKLDFLRGKVFEAKIDPLTKKPVEPDEKFLKRIERNAGIAESQADIARSQWYMFLLGDENREVEDLDNAIEKTLIEDNEGNIALLFDDEKPKSDEEKKRRHEVLDALHEAGCCDICSKELRERYYKLTTK